MKKEILDNHDMLKQTTKININPRLKNTINHVGGAMIKRESSILDGEELDKHGLSLRDY